MRVDGLPRARSLHEMAAVAPTKEAPRITYARAATTTEDPYRERAISFSIATISRQANSALEEEVTDSNDDEIPALVLLCEYSDFEEEEDIQALCHQRPPIKPSPFHRRLTVEFVSGLVINGKLSSGLWDAAACKGNWITSIEVDRLGSVRETAKVQVYTLPRFPDRTFTSLHAVYLDIDFPTMCFSRPQTMCRITEDSEMEAQAPIIFGQDLISTYLLLCQGGIKKVLKLNATYYFCER